MLTPGAVRYEEITNKPFVDIIAHEWEQAVRESAPKLDWIAKCSPEDAKRYGRRPRFFWDWNDRSNLNAYVKYDHDAPKPGRFYLCHSSKEVTKETPAVDAWAVICFVGKVCHPDPQGEFTASLRHEIGHVAAHGTLFHEAHDHLKAQPRIVDVPPHSAMADQGLRVAEKDCDAFVAGLFSWKDKYSDQVGGLLRDGAQDFVHIPGAEERLLEEAEDIEHDYTDPNKAQRAYEVARKLLWYPNFYRLKSGTTKKQRKPDGLHRPALQHQLEKTNFFKWGSGDVRQMDGWFSRHPLVFLEERNDKFKLRLAQWKYVRGKTLSKDEEHRLCKKLVDDYILPRIEWRYHCLQRARERQRTGDREWKPGLLGVFAEAYLKAAMAEQPADGKPDAKEQVARVVQHFKEKGVARVEVIRKHLPEIIENQVAEYDEWLRGRNLSEDEHAAELAGYRRDLEAARQKYARQAGIVL